MGTGQVLIEYNQGERPVPYMPEFLECTNGKVWPNDRPGLGISVDEKQLTFIEAMTEGARHHSPAAGRLADVLVGDRGQQFAISCLRPPGHGRAQQRTE